MRIWIWKNVYLSVLITIRVGATTRTLMAHMSPSNVINTLKKEVQKLQHSGTKRQLKKAQMNLILAKLEYYYKGCDKKYSPKVNSILL